LPIITYDEFRTGGFEGEVSGIGRRVVGGNEGNIETSVAYTIPQEHHEQHGGGHEEYGLPVEAVVVPHEEYGPPQEKVLAVVPTTTPQ
jgi:hypothetical protein